MAHPVTYWVPPTEAIHVVTEAPTPVHEAQADPGHDQKDPAAAAGITGHEAPTVEHGLQKVPAVFGV